MVPKTFCRTKRISGGKGALTVWNRLKIIPIFQKVSLPVTSIGCQSMEWHTSTFQGPQNTRKSKSKIKCMSRFSFQPRNRSQSLRLKAERSITFTERFLKNFENKNNCRHHHNALSNNIPVALQPPYSHDLSLCDFFLFPRLKNHLKGRNFGTLENIQTAATDYYTIGDIFISSMLKEVILRVTLNCNSIGIKKIKISLLIYTPRVQIRLF